MFAYSIGYQLIPFFFFGQKSTVVCFTKALLFYPIFLEYSVLIFFFISVFWSFQSKMFWANVLLYRLLKIEPFAFLKIKLVSVTRLWKQLIFTSRLLSVYHPLTKLINNNNPKSTVAHLRPVVTVKAPSALEIQSFRLRTTHLFFTRLQSALLIDLTLKPKPSLKVVPIKKKIIKFFQPTLFFQKTALHLPTKQKESKASPFHSRLRARCLIIASRTKTRESTYARIRRVGEKTVK